MEFFVPNLRQNYPSQMGWNFLFHIQSLIYFPYMCVCSELGPVGGLRVLRVGWWGYPTSDEHGRIELNCAKLSLL